MHEKSRALHIFSEKTIKYVKWLAEYKPNYLKWRWSNTVT